MYPNVIRTRPPNMLKCFRHRNSLNLGENLIIRESSTSHRTLDLDYAGMLRGKKRKWEERRNGLNLARNPDVWCELNLAVVIQGGTSFSSFGSLELNRCQDYEYTECFGRDYRFETRSRIESVKMFPTNCKCYWQFSNEYTRIKLW